MELVLAMLYWWLKTCSLGVKQPLAHSETTEEPNLGGIFIGSI